MPRPGIEPRTSCIPGRRANHYTTAVFRFCTPILASINLLTSLTLLSGLLFTAIGDPIIFRFFSSPTDGGHYLFIWLDLQTLYCIGNKYLRNREQHDTGNNINRISVQKSVVPRPGIEPRTSCIPGRRANHYTTAVFRFCTPILASINLLTSLTLLSGLLFTAIGDPIIFRFFSLPTDGGNYLFILFIWLDLQTLYCIGNKYLRNREQHDTGNYINKQN